MWKRHHKSRPSSSSATSTPTPAAISTRFTPASTETREKLHKAELERDDLKSLASRLKREGEHGPTVVEAENRLLKLRLEELLVKGAAPRRSTAGLFKEAYSTDVLFLMDTTGSMRRYIKSAKEQVQSMMADIKSTSFNHADVRFAVVGYKDHGDWPNIQFIDFTTNVDDVHNFLGTLTATGGDDIPGDVLGGLSKALSLLWEHPTRCIIHIADAPPHGRALHDLQASNDDDDYPTPGSEPHGHTYGPLLNEMIALNINYTLLRITKYTDRMAFTFLEAYATVSPNCSLLENNRYYSQACNLLESSHKESDCKSKGAGDFGALQFEEAKLDTAYASLRPLVVKSVTKSATLTATRITSSSSRHGSKPPRPGSKLAAIKEDDTPASEPKLETTAPQWDTPGWLDKTIQAEAYFPDINTHGATSPLDPMLDNDTNIKITTTNLTIHCRSRPFAQGSQRYASYARTAASTNHLVVKSTKSRGSKDRLAHLTENMRCQALCKAFSLEFNALTETPHHSIDFVTTACLVPRHSDADTCMALEPYIPGTYVKYNNNAGWVNDALADDPFHQAAQAFSHFTFERSRGRFLVADLQGVGQVLTDPAIHTSDPARFPLMGTNLGEEGFKFFFARHTCNGVCRKLGLESDGAMVLGSDTLGLRFRTTWLAVLASTMRVCCSNKLCSRIMALSLVFKSAEFPGYHWCSSCWCQLYRSKVSLLCVAEAGKEAGGHEFVVSRFFYESQGRVVPRTCPRHRVAGEGLVIGRLCG